MPDVSSVTCVAEEGCADEQKDGCEFHGDERASSGATAGHRPERLWP